ncbi:mandelate racemase/muconate lactonizing enzyme family protein [Archaeoglobus neptunius]|uniref:mandelate racemase/muconate lactonizing enzyme family protein n=1 Tax=Archaeoglobus neptunius TaxID=2798580 RepID=UPI0019290B5F|nr:mandelate racemase/muconate lactonizing enzyme family protein [Archaeoglobus neptunius]
MKIDDLKVHVISQPLREPVRFSWEPFPRPVYVYSIVEVESDGYRGYSAIEFGPAYKQFLETTVKMTLQVLGTEEIDERLLEIGSWAIQRLGAFEVALWDLKAKMEGLPLYRLLGGTRRRVKIYASTGRLLNPEDTLKLVEKYVEMGIDTVKLRFRRERIEDDLEVLKAAVSEFGDLKIAVDANQAWSYTPPYWSRKVALKVARELENYDVLWLEEPLWKDDVEGYRWLRENTTVEIAGGELEHGLQRFRMLIENGAFDIVQADAVYSNGIAECRKVAAVAEAFGIRFMPHAWDPGLGWLANLHLAASLPEKLCPYIETPFDPLWWDEVMFGALNGRVEIENGYAVLPETPGLGLEPDEEKLRKMRI